MNTIGALTVPAPEQTWQRNCTVCFHGDRLQQGSVLGGGKWLRPAAVNSEPLFLGWGVKLGGKKMPCWMGPLSLSLSPVLRSYPTSLASRQPPGSEHTTTPEECNKRTQKNILRFPPKHITKAHQMIYERAPKWWPRWTCSHTMTHTVSYGRFHPQSNVEPASVPLQQRECPGSKETRCTAL